MHQTITTKFLPATTHKASRIKATASGGASITIPYDYDAEDKYGSIGPHRSAMVAIVARLKWDDKPMEWAIGDTKTGYVFVSTRKGLTIWTGR